MGRGVWQATVHGVTESRTRLTNFHFTSYLAIQGFPGDAVVKNMSASVGDARDAGSIPGWRRSPGEGNGNPLQYSCLENPMDKGAWWATDPNVHRSTVYNSQDMKQPRCPSADEWIRKLWYIYTMEYYSAFKKNRMNQF